MVYHLKYAEEGKVRYRGACIDKLLQMLLDLREQRRELSLATLDGLRSGTHRLCKDSLQEYLHDERRIWKYSLHYLRFLPDRRANLCE